MSHVNLRRISLAFLAVFICSSCAGTQNSTIQDRHTAGTGPAEQLQLPAPFITPSVRNTSKVIGWPKGKMPTAAPGFEVSLFAENLNNPRQAYVLPNKDILVVEAVREFPDRPAKSGNQITLFRDTNNDGRPDVREVFLTGLTMPHGMVLVGDWFYVGNTNGVVRYPYRAGQTKIDGKGEKILDLPAGGHYTRNLLTDPAGKKIYVAVGSASNVDEENQWEKDQRRAGIVEINLDGSGARIFANGLRNPVGMDWEPQTKTLWTVVNERDLLGDDLVPDYLTSVKDGGFYGWPYSYFGQTEDPRKKGQRPDLVAKAIKPDYALGSHTAALGLAFYKGGVLPQRFQGGAFIGMHGSWNRSKMVGYKVAFVPFKNGKPSGPLEDILTGFVADESKFEAYGRPVGVTVAPDGALLVADDSGGKVWRVSAKK
ncbi:MAG TPA: sorbosone dehydrogenase family protein [Candidatus Saccharimonadales bacterium]|nr:sorbosone dehydrogenase family protein [Candidatus Saccharimonadales bacterium]